MGIRAVPVSSVMIGFCVLGDLMGTLHRGAPLKKEPHRQFLARFQNKRIFQGHGFKGHSHRPGGRITELKQGFGKLNRKKACLT
jgi:hypothetical protein